MRLLGDGCSDIRLPVMLHQQFLHLVQTSCEKQLKIHLVTLRDLDPLTEVVLLPFFHALDIFITAKEHSAHHLSLIMHLDAHQLPLLVVILLKL